MMKPTCCGQQMELVFTGDRYLGVCKICRKPAVVITSQSLGQERLWVAGQRVLVNDPDWLYVSSRA